MSGQLPPGFTLDDSPELPGLPPGFQLDPPPVTTSERELRTTDIPENEGPINFDRINFDIKSAFSSDPDSARESMLAKLNPDLPIFEDESGVYAVDGNEKIWINKPGPSVADALPIIGGALPAAGGVGGAKMGAKYLGKVGALLGFGAGATGGSVMRQAIGDEGVDAQQTGEDVALEGAGQVIGAGVGKLINRALPKNTIEEATQARRGDLDKATVDAVKAEEKAARAGVSDAYRAVPFKSTSLDADAFKTEIAGFQRYMSRGHGRLNKKQTPATFYALKDMEKSLAGIPNGNLKLKLQGFEDWRRDLFVNASPKNAQDRKALSALRNYYDNAVQRTAIKAVESGDVEAIEQLYKARRMHSQLMDTFNNPKSMQWIMGEGTPNAIMDKLIGVDAVKKGQSGLLLEQVKRNVSAETFDAMKQSFFSRLVTGPGGETLDSAKMVKKTRELLNRRSDLVGSILDPNERAILEKIAATDPLNMDKRLASFGEFLRGPMRVLLRPVTNLSGRGTAAAQLVGGSVAPQSVEELQEYMQTDYLDSLMGGF